MALRISLASYRRIGCTATLFGIALGLMQASDACSARRFHGLARYTWCAWGESGVQKKKAVRKRIVLATSVVSDEAMGSLARGFGSQYYSKQTDH